MYRITRQADHLRVEFESMVTVEAILQALAEVFGHPEYPRLNDVWVFNKATVFLKQSDLETIVDRVRTDYPPNSQKNKTALVPGAGFNQFLAESYLKAAARLPLEIEVFQALPDAESWLAAS